MKKIKIIELDGYAANPGDLSYEVFEQLGEFVVYPRTKDEDVVERAKDADAILINKVNIDGDVMDALPKLKYIGILATGYNVVDIDAATKRGIIVTNIPAYSTYSVAQMTFSLLLAMTNRVEYYAQNNRKNSVDLPLGIQKTTLEGLFSVSDVLSLHCPLTDATRNIINKENIAKMKTGAILINTGRGPLVDEEAVAEALHEGKLAGYGADVMCQEPPLEDNPLMKEPNAYITPHIAWATVEARTRLFEIAAENIRSFIAGNPQNVVNKEVLVKG